MHEQMFWWLFDLILFPGFHPACVTSGYNYGWAWESDDHQAYSVTQLWPMYTQLLCWTTCTWWGFNPKNFGDKSTWIFFTVSLLLTPALLASSLSRLMLALTIQPLIEAKGCYLELNLRQKNLWVDSLAQRSNLLVDWSCWLECSSNRESTWT